MRALADDILGKKICGCKNNKWKKRFFGLSFWIAALLIAGCGAGRPDHSEYGTYGQQSTANTESQQNTSEMASMDLSDLLLAPWQDNTLDAYTAVVNVPMKYEIRKADILKYEEETETAEENSENNENKSDDFSDAPTYYAAAQSFSLANEKSCSFWYIMKEQNWNGSIVGYAYELADSAGNSTECQLNPKKYGLTHLDYLGMLDESGHLYASSWQSSDTEPESSQNSKAKAVILELSEDLEVISRKEWECVSEEFYEPILQMKRDAEGDFHMLTRATMAGEESRSFFYYKIVSPEGVLLTEPVFLYSGLMFKGDPLVELVTLPDGRIGLQNADDKTALYLSVYDKKSGVSQEIYTLEKGFANNLAVSMFDENTKLFADSVGIHKASLGGTEKETIYQWKNHGLTVQEINLLETRSDGSIHVVYRNSETANYLVITPTTEQREICKIQLVTSSFLAEINKDLAAQFNRMYPMYHLEIVEGADAARLQTQLIAGDAPVLLDSTVLGTVFYYQDQLWEPLDGVIESLGLDGELVEKALDGGRLNGKLYGIPPFFSLETVITPQQDVKSWDYEEFFRQLESAQGLEALAQGYLGTEYPMMMEFFLRDVKDNAFFDAQKVTTSFASERFRFLLDTMEKYHSDNWNREPETFRAGKVFCQPLSILKPADIILTRIEYGDDVNFIGYPGKDGAANLLMVNTHLAVNHAASDMEKAGALLFLKLMLSYEGQKAAEKSLNFQFSVRKDCLEEQLGRQNKNSFVSDGVFTGEVGEHYNPEKDREIFYGILENSVPRMPLPQGLRVILSEELDAYFEKQISREDLISHLENRVTLYLREQ